MLVVDDIAEITELLSFYLASRGYEIARAYNGRQAIDKALFFRPHVIVLNLMMPLMSGDKAAGYLRAHPATQGAKIIMTSGFPFYEDLCLSAGADAFLSKPFSMRDLDALLSRLLSEGV